MVGDVYGSRWVFWRWERGMRREACGLWIRVLRGLDGKRLVGGGVVGLDGGLAVAICT